MKRYCASAIVLSLFFWCCNKIPLTECGRQQTFLASFGDPDPARTILINKTQLYWSPGDQIKVFTGSGNSAKFLSQNTSYTPSAVFAGSLVNGEESVWAVYPFNEECTMAPDRQSLSIIVPHEQIAIAGNINGGYLPMMAKSDNGELLFRHICGGICFSVSHENISSVTFRGKKDETVSGTFAVGVDQGGLPVTADVISPQNHVTVFAPDRGVFEVGVEYYMTLIPTVLAEGFSLTYSENGAEGVFQYDRPVAISRSAFARLSEKDDDIVFTLTDNATDLSANGTANSYIVSASGFYKFKASCKGNGSIPLDGIPTHASLLWESFGDASIPEAGSLINQVTYRHGYILFSTPSGIKYGNALIALKDKDENILWSWHIWLTPSPLEVSYKNNAGIMMDRNLGSIGASYVFPVQTFGLLYQWGRKDPFLGTCQTNTNILASSSVAWPSSEMSSETTGTIAFTVRNPMVFVGGNNKNNDWYYSGGSTTDNSRWGSVKTIYDPCPPGWRVPDGGSGGVWAHAAGSSNSFTTSYWYPGLNSSHFSILGAWYPAPGYRSSSGLLGSVGTRALYWSCTPYNGTPKNEAYALYIYYDHECNVIPVSATSRATAASVRCVRDK